MNTNAPTPETDAHILENGFEIAGVFVGSHVHPDFARKMERERDAYRDKAAKYDAIIEDRINK